MARATEIVNKAFKAGGAATSEQVNAILQLSQALGSGVLQGDELRSIRENAPLLAKAIADEFDTSIAGLKALGAEGELTSARVFKAILNAGQEIDRQFATTVPTIADSLTRLQTEFGRYINGANAASGASAQLAGFIAKVADNFDLLADAAIVTASVIGGALAGRAMVQAVAGLSALAAGATGAAGAMTILRGAMAYLGGPWGAAITVIGAALGYVALEAGKAKIAQENLGREIRDNAQAAGTLKEETGELGGKLRDSTTWAASLTGEVDKLSEAHYRAAAAAKAQAIEAQRLSLVEARSQLLRAKEAFQERRSEEAIRAFQAGGISGAEAAASGANLPGSRVREPADRAALQSQEYKDLLTATENVAAQTANLRAELGRSLEDPRYKPAEIRDVPAAPSSTGKTPRDRTDERAAQIDGLIAQARRDELQARADLATSVDDRVRFEREALAEEAAAEMARLNKLQADIADDKGLSAAKKAELTAQIEAVKVKTAEVAGLRQQLLDREATDQLARDALDLSQAEIDGAGELLQLQANMATTAKARRDAELRLLDLADQRERVELEAIIAAQTATDAEKQLARLRLQQLEQSRPAREEAVRRDTAGPLEAYVRDTPRTIDEMNEAAQRFAVEGLDALTSGLAQAALQAESLGDVARNVFRQIAADLLEAFIRKNVTAPVARAFAGFFADGGTIPKGQWGIVGENGPEPVKSTAGGVKVLPNSALRPLASMGGAATTTVIQNITLDNRGAMIWENEAARLMAYADSRARMATLQGGALGAARARESIGRSASRTLIRR